MSALNKVLLIGNLGKDPEIRYTPDGTQVATFSLATSETWNDKSGNRQEHTEWHTIVAWNKLAELSKRYLSKGRQVYIEGRLRTREWTDKEGNKRRTTEVIASQMVLLGSRPQSAEAGGAAPQPYQKPAGAGEQETGPDLGITDDDIPF